ncbi:MAG: DUF4367 domain-containing protein [Clostridia bacterium]|nr:DUF4367 domain-containing protein [Clostridia bacterium]
MTKAELKDAFRTVVSKEFQNVPREDEIDHRFSPAFLKRMEKLFRKQKRFYWEWVNSRRKRVAVALILAAALLATACGIPAVRKTLARFAVEIYDTFASATVEQGGTDSIKKEYRSQSIPDGFIETVCKRQDQFIEITYEDNMGRKIVFRQRVVVNSQFTRDIEKGDFLEETVGSREVLFLESSEVLSFTWLQNGYRFDVLVHGDVSNEAIFAMIAGVAS